MDNLIYPYPNSYLKQHSDQYVNWMPWSAQAFEKAQKENKPILISIGYAACHWCQEMSRNCYQDSYIGKLMNRHFVCVLIDKEVRPDLDHTYMEAIRMFDQSPGWPLHAFCLPDGRPFWGGTYFPKEDLSNGIAPWPQVIIRISEHYKNNKNELIENAESVIANIIHSNDADCSSVISWDNEFLFRAVQKIIALHDNEFGGFTSAPKFPSPMKLDFLLSISESQKVRVNPQISRSISKCINKTLSFLSTSAIFDHVGGGFFRYATQKDWSLPHYEKILSENALLIATFSNAYRKYRNKDYSRIILETLSWLNREMGTPQTGYASSLSAESENKEGAYYEWQKSEMIDCLGANIGEHYFQSLPDQPNGKKLPQLIKSEKVSKDTQIKFFQTLQIHRNQRTKPFLDQKRLLASNALMIRSYTDAALALGKISFIRDACLLESWIHKEMINEDFSLKSFSLVDYEEMGSKGFLDDYAFYIESILHLASVSELYLEGSSKKFIEKGMAILDVIFSKFKDSEKAGFFFSDLSIAPPPPCRTKIWYDNAIPSGNSSILRIFSMLYHLTHEKKWKEEFDHISRGYSKIAQKLPEAISHALSAFSQSAIGMINLSFKKEMKDELIKEFYKFPIRTFWLKTDSQMASNYKVKNADKLKTWEFNDIQSLVDFLND